jgi:hypothetical protein
MTVEAKSQTVPDLRDEGTPATSSKKFASQAALHPDGATPPRPRRKPGAQGT